MPSKAIVAGSRTTGSTLIRFDWADGTNDVNFLVSGKLGGSIRPNSSISPNSSDLWIFIKYTASHCRQIVANSI